MSGRGGQSGATLVQQSVPQPAQAIEEEPGISSAEKPKSDDSQVISTDNPQLSTLNKGKKRGTIDSDIEPRKG
jgi:hypothetical protein